MISADVALAAGLIKTTNSPYFAARSVLVPCTMH